MQGGGWPPGPCVRAAGRGVTRHLAGRGDCTPTAPQARHSRAAALKSNHVAKWSISSASAFTQCRDLSGCVPLLNLAPAEIEICRRPDGSDWELGSGGFGKVRWVLDPQAVMPMRCHRPGQGRVARISAGRHRVARAEHRNLRPPVLPLTPALQPFTLRPGSLVQLNTLCEPLLSCCRSGVQGPAAWRPAGCSQDAGGEPPPPLRRHAAKHTGGALPRRRAPATHAEPWPTGFGREFRGLLFMRPPCMNSARARGLP